VSRIAAGRPARSGGTRRREFRCVQAMPARTEIAIRDAVGNGEHPADMRGTSSGAARSGGSASKRVKRLVAENARRRAQGIHRHDRVWTDGGRGVVGFSVASAFTLLLALPPLLAHPTTCRACRPGCSPLPTASRWRSRSSPASPGTQREFPPSRSFRSRWPACAYSAHAFDRFLARPRADR